ncbi:RloB family protein [Planctomycetota bacterium]
MVRSRPSKDLQRSKPSRSPNKIELIVCEGSCTEPAYFTSLRRKLRLPEVQIRVFSPTESEPINIIEYAISKKDQGFDKIWCVMDVEIPPHSTLDEAWEKACEISDLEVILTNPFFEYWLLLHFEKVITPFRNDTKLKKVLQKFHPTYMKTRIGFNILYPKITTAIRNSKEVLQKNKYKDDLRNCNPSTHVHRLVEHLQNIR